MTTLAEHIIVAGAEEHPPMLEKSMYDSWPSYIRLFIKGKKHGRIMLDSIDNGLLVYPTIKEDGHTRLKKYTKLTEAQQLQDDCDVQAININLHGLPPDLYALVNHQEAAKDIWDKVKLLMKGTELSHQECRLYNLFDKFASVQDFGIDVPIFQQGENSIDCINNPSKTEDLDAYDSSYDDISSVKAVLMANLSSCDSDVLSELQYSDTYLNDMINQEVQEMSYSEQTHIVDFPDNEITSEINIIPYSQYLQESQYAGIQDMNSSTPNDLLDLSLFEQMTDHVANLDKENQINKMVNESLTAELERHKERVAIF
nr:hypothetical protein [Tanacetum cinerariifolium]